MKKQLQFALFLILPLGCSQDIGSSQTEFKSKFILETNDATISKTEGDPLAFSNTYIAKRRINDRGDSSEITMTVGLGERQEPGKVYRNTLYVSFINRFATGFSLTETKFRDWVSASSHSYVADGSQENGIGVVWFDEHGEIWVSGANIGIEGLIGKAIIPQNPNQQNSTFLLLSSEEAATEYPSFYYTQKVIMKFKCMLYNDKNGSIEIKDATFDALLNIDHGD